MLKQEIKVERIDLNGQAAASGLIASCEALLRPRLQQRCFVKKVLTLLHHLS
jgi:hypothetical protein